MREIKIITDTNLKSFEKLVNEIIKEHSNAIIDYKPVMGDNSYTIHYTALIEYRVVEERVIPNVEVKD